MLRTIAILFALACTCAGQDLYNVIYEGSLSAAAGAVTIQNKTGSKTTVLRWVSVQCSVACSIYLEKNGTAATSTAVTPTPVNDADAATSPVKFNAYRDSNVGVGTKMSPTYELSAGQILPLDLEDMEIKGANDGKNVTLRIASMTGDYSVHFRVRAIR